MRIGLGYGFTLVACLWASSLFAKDVLLVTSPVERQVVQRDAQNQREVSIVGTIEVPVDTIEAKVDLAPGSKHGTPVDWTVIAESKDVKKGQFSGRIRIAAGGWYALSIRGRKAKAIVGQAKVTKIGVGDVYITAGQSNSANYGKPRQSAKDDRVVYYDGKAYVPAKDPIPGGAGKGGSVWPILGDQIAASQRVPVCFRSATLTWTEVKNWMPGVRLKKHRLFENLSKCAVEFGRDGVRAVLWHQGESDSLAKTPAATYFNRLKTVIDALNERAGYRIPWFVAQASFHPKSKSTQEQEVAKGQRLLWEKGVASRGPVTDDLGAKYRSDGVHFNQLGLSTRANRWFEALSAEFKWKAAR